jgi:Zn-dependent peptidase ImmA (M78 family)
MNAPGGPIRVRQLQRVHVERKPCWGSWSPSTRTISIERGAPREYQLHTLYHEWAHAVLHDSGLEELLSEAGQEALCQALATARMAELR